MPDRLVIAFCLLAAAVFYVGELYWHSLGLDEL